jgi:hypothetical protein
LWHGKKASCRVLQLRLVQGPRRLRRQVIFAFRALVAAVTSEAFSLTVAP